MERNELFNVTINVLYKGQPKTMTLGEVLDQEGLDFKSYLQPRLFKANEVILDDDGNEKNRKHNSKLVPSNFDLVDQEGVDAVTNLMRTYKLKRLKGGVYDYNVKDDVFVVAYLKRILYNLATIQPQMSRPRKSDYATVEEWKRDMRVYNKEHDPICDWSAATRLACTKARCPFKHLVFKTPLN